MVQFIRKQCKIFKSPFTARYGQLVWLLCSLLWCSVSAAGQFYAIEVQPVKIYQRPGADSIVIHSLYKANHIQVLQLQSKWAKIKFRTAGKDIVGWVEKTKIFAEPQNAVVDPATEVTEIRPVVDFFIENQYAAKALNSDLHCVKTADQKSINGCVLDIDLEVKGPENSNLVEVSCKAEFELSFKGTQNKQVWQQKNIRTPLKKGKGAARIQLALMPVIEKSADAISVLSYQCRLEKIL